MDSYVDTQRVNQLIYGGEIYNEEDYDSMLDRIDDFPRGTEHGCRRPSLYLRLFEDMINTVYEHESHLLSESEWDVFGTLKCYCYNARYCLIRLVLRKPDQWHALSSLGSYKKEVGEVGLIRAITDLCRPWTEVINGIKVEAEMDGVGLLEESQCEDVKIPLKVEAGLEAGPSNSSNTNQNSRSTLSDRGMSNLMCQDGFEQTPLDTFCYDESSMDTTQLLGRLSVKQLKDLVKATKTKPVKFNKPEMIRVLLAHAATQCVLEFAKSSSEGPLRRPPGPRLRQTTLPGVESCSKGKGKAVQRNQEQRLVQMVLKILGKCVRVNGDFYRLVRRLHLITFRCTEQPASLMLPALLTCFKKRAYPQYKYKRDKSIWPNREDLLAYEEALDLEAELEEVASKASEKDRELKTPRPTGSVVVPMTPIGKILRTPQTPFRTPKDPPLVGLDMKEEPEDKIEDEPTLPELVDVEAEEASVRKAKAVKEFLYEKVYSRWKELIETKAREGCSTRKPALERFETGYIYTRMLHRSSRCFATLKEYQAEFDLIQDLLAQRFYRRGSRAKWYERRAILQMMYLSKIPGRKRDHEVLRQAMGGVKEALADEDTGIVWRPGLFRRLQRLEKMLHIPEEECTPPEVDLREPKRVFIKAVRAMKRESSVPIESDGGNPNMKNGVEAGGLHSFFPPKKNPPGPKENGDNVPKEEEKKNGAKKSKPPIWKGKSLWIGRDNEEVYVEIRVLQYYETLGFKGLHSETRILTTLFSLLFWDIIFADVPGAFETPYQTAPLDLAEDTFYYARKDMIERRLEEIYDGSAKEILERHDNEHREKQTMCIGLRWDICEKADLIDIAACLGGRTLSLICRLFCEDYGGRSSGVPDLVIWDASQGICKFVEVKGPGDRPQENQKLWFDSLLRAGANVEICHVIDMNAPPKEKQKTPGTSRKRKLQTDPLDEQGYDGDEPWLPSSDVKASVRRRGIVVDELPSYPQDAQSHQLLSPSRRTREQTDLRQTTLTVVESPCKRKKG